MSRFLGRILLVSTTLLVGLSPAWGHHTRTRVSTMVMDATDASADATESSDQAPPGGGAQLMSASSDSSDSLDPGGEAAPEEPMDAHLSQLDVSSVETESTVSADAAMEVVTAARRRSSGGDGSPGWITTCSYSHSNEEDPIVHPGHPGMAHLHDYSGASTTDAFSTPESLRAGGTTCAMADDTSAYWIPAVYEDGKRLLPTATAHNSLFYYRRKGAPEGTLVQPFPDGLKMIIGNADASSPSENPQLGDDIIFKCGPGSSTDLPAPPDRCGSGVMVLSLRFPNCWDGVNLDSADHRSHMAYPQSSRCPESHPVVLPRLESFFRYDVGTDRIGEITLSSGPYYTAHQDFFNGWVPSALEALVTECINAMVDCGKNPSV